MSASASPGNSIEIKLLGQRIALRAPESDPELVRQVVEIVTAKLGEVEARAKGAGAHQVALLALLEVAAEYVQAKQRTIEFMKDIGEKSGKLAGLIDAELE